MPVFFHRMVNTVDRSLAHSQSLELLADLHLSSMLAGMFMQGMQHDMGLFE